MLKVRVWCGAVVGCVLAGASMAGGVRLERSVVADGSDGLTVGEVARGEGVAGLADVVVLGAAEVGDARHVIVTVEDVRAALVEAGVRMGGVSLSGGRCVVRLRGVGVGGGEAEVDGGSGEEAWASADALVGARTVRGEVVRALLGDLGVEGGAGDGGDGGVRVRFVEGDAGLLDRGVDGERLTVRRVTGVGGRVGYVVSAFGADRGVVARGRVVVGVEVERSAWRVVARVERGGLVGAADVERVREWGAPGAEGRLSGAESPVGLEALERLEAGEVVLSKSVERSMLVERRSWATLFCHRGGLVIEARVVVLEDGALGDTVACRLEGSRDRVLAEVTGVGELTLVLGE